MSLADTPLAILGGNVCLDVFESQKDLHLPNISTNLTVKSIYKSVKSTPSKVLFNSRSSDSGKSNSDSPILMDCSFDSGIAGVLVDGKDMQLHKRIQQCQCILLALQRDEEYYYTIRNRLSKISNRKQKESNKNEFFCNVCCAEINATDSNTYVKCYICKKYICRSIKCSHWLPKNAEFECELCQTTKESLAQTSSWVADQITFNQEKLFCPPRARSEVYIPISEYNDSFIPDFDSVSQVDANSTTITPEQKFKIREFVEEVVAKLLGGNLDTVAVNQLSKCENYLPEPKVKNIHNGKLQESVGVRANANEFSAISETRLRQMIQKIIAETMNLPPLTNGHAVSEIALDRPSRATDNRKRSANNGYYQRHRTEHYFEPTIYQDLLATAVLNKIVDKQLNNNRGVSERDIGDIRGGNDVNYNTKFECSDENFEKSSTSSGSSVDPRSDCSYTEMAHILNNNDGKSSDLLRNSDRDSVISEYLANHMIPLPDLNAMATESEEDDYMSVTSSAVGEDTWEKNWLFRKKKSALSGPVTANSIGMLVPDPKEDVRAQIGDKTADEVSDLSELGSDSDNSLNSLRSQLEPINDRLVNKHLIGGQNSKIILDEIIERSSMISNTFSSDAEQVYTDACNAQVIDATTKTEAINENVHQQQSSTEQKVKDSTSALCSVALQDLSSNPLMGSIAEREYKKWYNAVEMPNNPYAPEALKRRISSGSQERIIDLPNISPTKDLNPFDLLNEPKLDADEDMMLKTDYKRYSRDYYINSSLITSQTSPARDVSAPVTKDNPEVNNNYNNINLNNSYQNKSRKANPKHSPNDCHWTLSTPVRRSSSLKYLNNSNYSPPPLHLHAPTYHQHQHMTHFTSSILQTRPSTSTSYYNHFNTSINNDDTEDGEDNIDLHSQRSWKSSLALNSKRKTISMLSLLSADSNRSSSMSRNNHIDPKTLAQFEKQLLHKDLKRNSFRAVSVTTKEFALNPLYEKDQSEKSLKPSAVESNQFEKHKSDSNLCFSNDCETKSKQY